MTSCCVCVCFFAPVSFQSPRHQLDGRAFTVQRSSNASVIGLNNMLLQHSCAHFVNYVTRNMSSSLFLLLVIYKTLSDNTLQSCTLSHRTDSYAFMWCLGVFCTHQNTIIMLKTYTYSHQLDSKSYFLLLAELYSSAGKRCGCIDHM